METLTYNDIAKLINHIGHTTLSTTPSDESPGRWATYQGSVRSGELSLRFYVMYLYADASLEHLRYAMTRRAELEKKDGRGVQVVYPPSLLDKIPRFKIDFAESLAKAALSSNEYLVSHFRQPLERYIKTIASLLHPHYVEPNFQAPAQYQRGNRNPVYNFLAQAVQDAEQQQGTIGVILAEPGQGKTFLTKYLAASMARSSAIPIYVHSDQWKKMAPDDLGSLSKTIVHSFRYFESPIGWIDGYEDEFLLVCLKAGIFRLIFDGLDEYILRNQGKVDASETVSTLVSLSERTGARILVTSRTSFWESEVADFAGRPGDHGNIVLFRIQPFDTGHATTYFQSRFDNSPTQIITSVKLFDHLKLQTAGAGVDLVGRGFFLYLIADLIARGYSYQHLDTGRLTATQWIIQALCDRENTRQTVPATFSAIRQVEVLREMALVLAKGDKVDSTTLRATLEVIADIKGPELDELIGSPDGKLRGKLEDHPIIQYLEHEGSWTFKQDQVFFVLLAETLFDLTEKHSRVEELKTFIAALRSSPGLQTDIATALVEQIFEVSSPIEANRKIKEVITAILGCIGFNLSGDNLQPAASLACTIATLTNNREFVVGSSRREKILGFIHLLPMGSINGLTFCGAISRFDCSGIVFSRCRFDQVTWIACDFNDSTEFHSCQFVGGTSLSSNGFGLAKWSSDCLFDREALAFVDGEKIRAGAKTYSSEDLKTDMALFIERFIAKGGMIFRRVEERNLIRGRFGYSLHRDEIIKASKRYVIRERDSVALKENRTYEVRTEAKDSLVHFSENGIFTGPIKMMLDELTADLRL